MQSFKCQFCPFDEKLIPSYKCPGNRVICSSTFAEKTKKVIDLETDVFKKICCMYGNTISLLDYSKTFHYVTTSP